MSSVIKKHFQGVLAVPIAASAAASRRVVIPLPTDGAWNVTGQVIVTNPASGRQTVIFNLAVSGNSVAGTATETDGVGPTAWPTQPSVNPFTGTLVTVILNAGAAGPPVVPPTLELEFTGSSIGGATSDWSWTLDATNVSVP